MKSWGIGDVAERSGVAASTIRYYEEINLLDPSVRQGGQRRYDSSVLTRLALIALAKKCGFSLDETRGLLNRFPEGTPPVRRWRRFSPRKLQEVDELLEKVHTMRNLLAQTLTCSCATLDECVESGKAGEIRCRCGE